MRFLSADYIFPIHTPPLVNAVLVVEDNGEIKDLLIPGMNEISSSLPLEKFNGIICPGFVNAHCHLELSHLKRKFSRGKGLPFFIGEMVEKRETGQEEILQAMVEADQEMFEGGIVAAGDISNNSSSAIIKNKSKIIYHTFVELFDIFPERADLVFSNGRAIKKEFSESGLRSSIVPHSYYTVTKRLMNLICDFASQSNDILCIHNQECFGENEMFSNGTGALIEKLQSMTGAYSDWKPPGNSSLVELLKLLNPDAKIQLVHNTFSGSNDIQMTLEKIKNVYWCLCLNANLFIENKTPDVLNFLKKNCVLTVGTDSYASNESLSILSELNTIQKLFPAIGLNELLKWSTINGAKFLGLSDRFGTFEAGKNPGINLISEIDINQLKFKPESKIKRLI